MEYDIFMEHLQIFTSFIFKSLVSCSEVITTFSCFKRLLFFQNNFRRKKDLLFPYACGSKFFEFFHFLRRQLTIAIPILWFHTSDRIRLFDLDSVLDTLLVQVFGCILLPRKVEQQNKNHKCNFWTLRPNQPWFLLQKSNGFASSNAFFMPYFSEPYLPWILASINITQNLPHCYFGNEVYLSLNAQLPFGATFIFRNEAKFAFRIEEFKEKTAK